MANIRDYIKWRGDLTFEHSPFNEVDNLIMTYVSYTDFDGIVSSDGSRITLAEASERYFETHTHEEIEKSTSFIKYAPLVVEDMARCARFKDIQLRHYVNVIDHDIECQFSAIEILLGDDTSYVAFRGTDDTIVGWKEDFYISNGEIPSEQEAARYLSRIAQKSAHPLRVGGHSKGGNLAVFAAMNCLPAVQKRVIEIYSNDGPGFSTELIGTDNFQVVAPLIRRIIPEFSVFGMIFDYPIPPTIIKSNQKQILQHDGLSWQVEGPAFVRGKRVNKSARLFSDSLVEWSESMTAEERTDFINDLFSVFEASGATTLPQLQSGGLKTLRAMFQRADDLAPETRKKVNTLLRILYRNWPEMLISK